MADTPLKRSLFEQLAQVSKAMGHANRLMILDVLAQGENDVESLHQKLNLSIANVSKHLQSLKQAGLVKNRRDKQHIIYRLSDESVFQLIVSLRQVAETQLDDMQTLLQTHLQPNTPLEPVSFDTLKRLTRDNQNYTLLDVRPEDEFAAGHLPNAINIPIEALTHNLVALNPQTPLIVYCRGPYCMWSKQAVETLLSQGFNAKRLMDGYPEWRSQQTY